MYLDDQVPRELEHYVCQARRMRREFIAGLWQQGIAVLSRGVDRVRRALGFAAEQVFHQGRHGSAH